jgi:uncharacterized protein YodC (DUF2158 family)
VLANDNGRHAAARQLWRDRRWHAIAPAGAVPFAFADTQAHRGLPPFLARVVERVMDPLFKVGDVVMQRSGSLRMKVAAVDKAAGRVRCTWVRGPAKHTQTFVAEELVTLIGKPRP